MKDEASVPMDIRSQAYDLFLNGGRTPTQIAVQTGVSVDDVRSWIKKGGWVARRDQIEREVFAAHEAKYRKFLIEKRLPVLEQQLERAAKLGELFDHHISAQSGEELKATQLKALAETLSNMAGVESRVVGVTDQVVADLGFRNEAKAKPMVAIINNAGGGPVPAQVTVKEVLDVKESDDLGADPQ